MAVGEVRRVREKVDQNSYITACSMTARKAGVRERRRVASLAKGPTLESRVRMMWWE